MLSRKKHFKEFAAFIRRCSGHTSLTSHQLLELKAVLWAVVGDHCWMIVLIQQGNIGSSRKGLPFLEEENVVKDIIEIAETSPILSLRGYPTEGKCKPHALPEHVAT